MHTQECKQTVNDSFQQPNLHRLPYIHQTSAKMKRNIKQVNQPKIVYLEITNGDVMT